MTRTDPDIAAVRQLPPGLIEPTDESVSRTWHSVTARRAVRARPRSRFRFLVPVTAAAVVSGLAVGAAVLFAPDRGGPTPQPAQTGPLEVERVMERLIEKAGKIKATPVGAGQVLYVRTETTSSPSSTDRKDAPTAKVVTGRFETWFDPQRMMPLRSVQDGKDVDIDGPDPDGSMAEDNRNIVAAGGSWYFPTPHWIAGLPTDPAALRAQLDKETFAKPGRNHLLGQLGVTFSRAEPLLPPRARVALYRLIADLDGITATGIKIDGRLLYAIGEANDHGTVESLLFDPESGRVVGLRTTGGKKRQLQGPDAKQYDPTFISQQLWTHRIVSGTDRRE